MARKRKLDDRSARHDAAYRRAKQEGFAARAVYKLQELDKRYSLLGQGRRVLDLGCWPGSWMQYTAQRVGEEGLVVGLDLQPVELALPAWCEAFVADVYELDPQVLLDRFGPFDVVLSDMAPKTIGDSTTDRLRSEALFERALDIAVTVLRPGGHFAGKVFQGGAFPALLARMRATFSQSKPFHTKATRTGSPEQYLVGQGRKAKATLDSAS
ncbi:MAG: RlmE family RNA methyltransferase [Nannocystaceae bacterium]